MGTAEDGLKHFSMYPVDFLVLLHTSRGFLIWYHPDQTSIKGDARDEQFLR